MTDAPKKPRQLPAFLSITRYATIAAARNPATLAFGFIFPVVFITVFGLLGSGATSVKIGISDQVSHDNLVVQSLEKVNIVKLQHGSEDELERQLKQGKIDAVMQVA